MQILFLLCKTVISDKCVYSYHYDHSQDKGCCISPESSLMPFAQSPHVTTPSLATGSSGLCFLNTALCVCFFH